MDGLVLVFLGAIALGSLAQVVFFVGLGLSGWRIARRVMGIQADVTRELRPVLENMSEVSRNVAVVSEVAVAQVQTLQQTIATTLGRIDGARGEVEKSMRRPFRSMGAVPALVRGMRRAMRVYRQLGGYEEHGKGASRTYKDDEHLFI